MRMLPSTKQVGLVAGELAAGLHSRDSSSGANIFRPAPSSLKSDGRPAEAVRLVDLVFQPLHRRTFFNERRSAD